MEMGFIQKVAALAEAEGFELSGLDDKCGNCEGIRCLTRDVTLSFRRRRQRSAATPKDQDPPKGSPPGQCIAQC